MLERDLQRRIIEEIGIRMPKAVVLKNDPTSKRGFPDLTILLNGRYALLEVKQKANSKRQPHQERYISEANMNGAFASFIHEDNLEEVLDGMERALEA